MRRTGYVADATQFIRGLSPLHDSGTGSSLGTYGNFEIMPQIGCDFNTCPTRYEDRLRLRKNNTDGMRGLCVSTPCAPPDTARQMHPPVTSPSRSTTAFRWRQPQRVVLPLSASRSLPEAPPSLFSIYPTTCRIASRVVRWTSTRTMGASRSADTGALGALTETILHTVI